MKKIQLNFKVMTREEQEDIQLFMQKEIDSFTSEINKIFKNVYLIDSPTDATKTIKVKGENSEDVIRCFKLALLDFINKHTKIDDYVKEEGTESKKAKIINKAIYWRMCPLVIYEEEFYDPSLGITPKLIKFSIKCRLHIDSEESKLDNRKLFIVGYEGNDQFSQDFLSSLIDSYLSNSFKHLDVSEITQESLKKILKEVEEKQNDTK
jgi:hypothetical protein